MTLQEAKDQIAREYRYESWESLRFCNSMNYGQWETFSDRAAELYAKEIADKAWEAGRSHEHAAHFGSVPNVHPDKSTFMKSLFPDTK